ncbi:MAG TPA: hypothetical protein VH475_29185 [Tepidisphaeraceae bacterium]
MAKLDYRHPDTARADRPRQIWRALLRCFLVVGAAVAMLGLTSWAVSWWHSKVHEVSTASARHELASLLGPLASKVVPERAAYQNYGDHWEHQVWWYRFRLKDISPDAFRSALSDAWRARQPQGVEGGVMRMGRNKPRYQVIEGTKAQDMLDATFEDAEMPGWWKARPPGAIRALVLSDTDEFFNGVSRWDLTPRYIFGDVLPDGVFYLYEVRDTTRYPIVLPTSATRSAQLSPASRP